jgi:lia operon protein LiaG
MMDNSSLKRVVGIVAAVVVVAGAAAAVIGLLGGIAPREAAAGTVAGTVAGGRIDVDQARSLPLQGVQRIDVDVVSSDVTVTESRDGSVNAHLYGTVNSNRNITVPELIAETRGATASFRVDHKNLNVVMGWYRSDLKLEVAIPRGYRGALVIHGVSADIALPPGRTFTELEFTTVSGDVTLGASAAESFTCRTVSGDVEAPAVSAKSVDLGSTSGEMTVGGLTGDLTARTVSGDLRLDWTAFSGSINVSTTSGEVTLGIPAGSGFRLDAGSTSGRITSDHAVTVRGSASGPGRHSLTGDVGSGAGSVRVRTVSGGIRIGM